MKRYVRTILTLTAFTIAGAVHADDYPTTVRGTVQPHLVGYWRFEADANSSVVSGTTDYTGAFLGDAAIGGTGSGPTFLGVADNHAALFDGNGDGVLTNLAAQETFPSAVTIVAWIYLNEQPSTSGRTLYIAGRSQVANDMDFQIDPDNIMRFYTTVGGPGGSVSAPAALPLHQWIMVAASFDTSPAVNSRKIYIDGNLVGSDQPGTHSANNVPFSIAYSTVWGNRWFPGAIDEVAIWNTALSDADVRGLEDAAGDLIFRSGFEY